LDRVRMSQVMEVRIHLSTVRVGVIMVWRREHSTGMVTSCCSACLEVQLKVVVSGVACSLV